MRVPVVSVCFGRLLTSLRPTVAQAQLVAFRSPGPRALFLDTLSRVGAFACLLILLGSPVSAQPGGGGPGGGAGTPPVIHSSEPNTDTGTLTIAGTNFGTALPTVTVAGLQVAVLSNNNTQIVTALPVTIPKSYLLTVTKGGTTATATFVVGIEGGDISAVTADFGLTGGAISGEALLGVDIDKVQARVTGVCSAGSSIREIDSTGNVVCEAGTGGDITAVTVGVGLTGGGLSGDVAFGLNTDFTDSRYASAAHGHTVNQVVGAATLGANTFGGNQTVNGSIAATSAFFSGQVGATVGGGAIAIQGTSTAGTATGFGLVGRTSATQGASAGVYGLASAASGAGSVHGVYGETTGLVGAAVRGLARQGVGVEGYSEGVNGLAMLAQMPSGTGSGTALLATVNSATATPGVFQNNGGGNLVIGKVSGVEKFRVDGGGAVYATSYLDLAGTPIASGDITSVNAGTGLTGGAASGDVGLALNTAFTDARYALAVHGHTVSQVAGAATLGANIFAATQTIDAGNLDLDSSTATVGNITKNGVPFLHDFGTNNSFVGRSAGNFTMTGVQNAGIGFQALVSNTSGGDNTAVGNQTLSQNTTGQGNTAIGGSALPSNTTGFLNTAVGGAALASVSSGFQNTAVGANALAGTTGNRNVGVGQSAGGNATNGSNNIYLGAFVSGVVGESNTIYIGNQGSHTKTVIGGIQGVTTGNVNAVPVMIDSAGQLGTLSSSRRFKEDIRDMAETSGRLFHLRPVMFRYKQAYADGSKPVQYGLIAEEVAEVFPELAVRDAKGDVETVHYETLSVLLLNELQKQQKEVQRLSRELRQQREDWQRERDRIEALEQRLNELLNPLESQAVTRRPKH